MKRYTQRKFGKITGIPSKTLSNWAINGKFPPVETNGARKPSYYDESQIEAALALYKKRRKRNPAPMTPLEFGTQGTPQEQYDVDQFATSTDEPNTAELHAEVPPAGNFSKPKSETVAEDAASSPDIEPTALTTMQNTLPTSDDDSTHEPAITLDQRANRIRELRADVQRGTIEIGFELIAAKKEIGHGGWAKWLETEFSWTQQTANRLMRVAERFGKLNNVVQFQTSTLQAMLALPEGTEQDFIDEQADAGRPIETQSARDVQKHVKEFKHKNEETQTIEIHTQRVEPPTPTRLVLNIQKAEPKPPQKIEIRYATGESQTPAPTTTAFSGIDAAEPLPDEADIEQSEEETHGEPFNVGASVTGFVTRDDDLPPVNTPTPKMEQSDETTAAPADVEQTLPSAGNSLTGNNQFRSNSRRKEIDHDKPVITLEQVLAFIEAANVDALHACQQAIADRLNSLEYRYDP